MTSTLTQKSWEVPAHFDDSKFPLMSVFSHGGADTTNIRERSANFGDLFLKVACQKCDRPESLKYEDLKKGEIGLLNDLFPKNKGVWSARVPIKLVGYLLTQQKLGNSGLLLTDGTKNCFICRSRFKKDGEEGWTVVLALVCLVYDKGWRITTCEFAAQNPAFEGPCRVYISKR